MVAAVRRMASMGPMHSTMAHMSAVEGILPMRAVTVGTSLPENGKHSQQGQSDVGHKVTEKAGQPLRTRFQSQIRGEG